MMINKNELINKSIAIGQLLTDLREYGVKRGIIEYSLNKLSSLQLEAIERDWYSRGWHDAINKAMKESVCIQSFDGTFKVIQAETLEGLGISIDCNMEKEFLNAKEEISMNEDRELKEARDECVRLGLLQKQGKNLNGTDTYVKTEKGERIFKELLEDARNGIVYD